MKKINPCLWFDHEAKEVSEFYVGIFSKFDKDAKVTLVTHYSESGSKVAGMPKGTVMTVSFMILGQEFMALNGGSPPEGNFKFSHAISFMVNCDTQEEIDYLWDRLKEGGEEEVCGWLRDKYGISWQIVPVIMGELMKDKDPKKVESVMKAMLEMKKLDIAELKKAYEGK